MHDTSIENHPGCGYDRLVVSDAFMPLVYGFGGLCVRMHACLALTVWVWRCVCAHVFLCPWCIYGFAGTCLRMRVFRPESTRIFRGKRRKNKSEVNPWGPISPSTKLGRFRPIVAEQCVIVKKKILLYQGESDPYKRRCE